MRRLFAMLIWVKQSARIDWVTARHDERAMSLSAPNAVGEADHSPYLS